MEKVELMEKLKGEKVKFIRLQFTDIMGQTKNVEIPDSQFEKAMDGKILFDGSSIEGFTRIEESDMLLKPDLDSFQIFPWEDIRGKVGRFICDIYNPDDTPFEGCPRMQLKKVCEEAKQTGYTMMAGPEAEFFLFQKSPNGDILTETHDAGGYFDLTPVDRGEDARRDMVLCLEKMGYEIEAAHHEVAPGQHEIDFKYSDAVSCADNLSTFRFVVKKIANDYGLHATFMPKPIAGMNGSGMHTHQSLFKGSENAFADNNSKYQLSETCLHYIGGLLEHARGFCAITNPLVNSYKRLVPGYEAPTHLAWSEKNRSPLIRVPAKRGHSTRCELRMPDPACNPYLAFAVMLKAGLNGIRRKLDPGEPTNKNIFAMSKREMGRLKIKHLPENLDQAIDCLEKDEVIAQALGTHIFEHFVAAKRKMWRLYSAEVHDWEVKQYLAVY